MNNNDWLAVDVLEDYLDGKLDAKTMHQVERLSLEDPFVAEALAGLSKSPKRTQTLSLLQKQLEERVAQKPIEAKRWQITSQRLSIAAAAAVLFVIASLLFWMRESNNREQIAANTPKKVEVAIATNKVTEKPVVKAKEEVEKIITETKKNTYANHSKKRSSSSIQPPVVALAEIPLNSLEDKSEKLSLRAIAIQENKKELAAKQAASALSGKVAGLKMKSNVVQGVVYGEDKLPISGASVKLKGSSLGATTDSKGQFSLMVDSLLNSPSLQVAYLGFMPKEVNFKKNENLSIELKPNGQALNEVVIRGNTPSPLKRMSAASVTSVVKSPEPLGNWNEFEEYIVNNNRLLIDKKLTGRDITLRFKINKKGNPTNIRVVKNPSLTPKQTKEEENEAIRLLKNGPKWNNPTSSTEASVTIRF